MMTKMRQRGEVQGGWQRAGRGGSSWVSEWPPACSGVCSLIFGVCVQHLLVVGLCFEVTNNESLLSPCGTRLISEIDPSLLEISPGKSQVHSTGVSSRLETRKSRH